MFYLAPSQTRPVIMNLLRCCRLATSLELFPPKYHMLHKAYGKCLMNSNRLLKSHNNQYHHLCRNIQSLTINQNGYSSHHVKLARLHSNVPSGNVNELNLDTSAGGKVNELVDFETLRADLINMREIGMNVPEVISDADLEYYATLTSKRGRKKFLSFLFKRENLRKREKARKVQRQAERKNSFDDEAIEGTMPINRLLRRISAVTMLTSDNWRLASAMKFGSQVAFDFSFDEHMARPEVVSMVSQLTHVLNANKQAKNPFYIHWTGLKEEGLSFKEMNRMFGGTFEKLMVNVTDKDVLDVFPNDKLVYLTADSANIMHTFDHDKVYIVGGLVDARTVQSGITLAKAKRYNINHARFPLDLYLQWALGAKTLTLDQVARILLNLQETQDWTEALKNVPTRKHDGFKVNHPIDHRVIQNISTRPELERYYSKQKESIQKKQSYRETIVTDSGRFSFSRAKREYKWDLLESEGSDEKKFPSSVWNDEDDADFDPTGDTLFSSTEKVHTNRRRGRKGGSKWFEE